MWTCHRPSAAGPHCGLCRAPRSASSAACHRPSAAGPHCGIGPYRPKPGEFDVSPALSGRSSLRPRRFRHRRRARPGCHRPSAAGPHCGSFGLGNLRHLRAKCHRPSAAGPHCGSMTSTCGSPSARVSPALSGRSSLRPCHRQRPGVPEGCVTGPQRPVLIAAFRCAGDGPRGGGVTGPQRPVLIAARARRRAGGLGRRVSPALSGRSSLRLRRAGAQHRQRERVTGPQRPVLIAARPGLVAAAARGRVTGPQRPVLIAARPFGSHGRAEWSGVTGPQRPVLIAAPNTSRDRPGTLRVSPALSGRSSLRHPLGRPADDPVQACHRPSAAGPHCGRHVASVFGS